MKFGERSKTCIHYRWSPLVDFALLISISSYWFFNGIFDNITNFINNKQTLKKNVNIKLDFCTSTIISNSSKQGHTFTYVKNSNMNTKSNPLIYSNSTYFCIIIWLGYMLGCRSWIQTPSATGPVCRFILLNWQIERMTVIG